MLTCHRWHRATWLGVITTICLLVFQGNISFAQVCGAIPGIVAGPISYSVNQHRSYLLEEACWDDAEAKAVSMGGHLVTLNDQEEARWVYSCVPPVRRHQ